MDATKTRNELVTEALEKLNVIGTGQEPEAEDAEKVDGKVDTTLAWLASREFYYVADDEEIPAEAFDWIADILAWRCAANFGKAGNPSLEGNAATARNELLALSASKPTYETLRTEYY